MRVCVCVRACVRECVGCVVGCVLRDSFDGLRDSFDVSSRDLATATSDLLIRILIDSDSPRRLLGRPRQVVRRVAAKYHAVRLVESR